LKSYRSGLLRAGVDKMSEVLWEFEKPITVTATSTANVTWQPTTFRANVNGEFYLTMWLLRDDSKNDAVVSNYLPALLFSKTSLFLQ